MIRRLSAARSMFATAGAFLMIIFVSFSAAGTAAAAATWAKTYGGPYADYPRSVQKTDDGGYIMAGRSWSFMVSAQNEPDLWVVKVDARGDIEWQKSYCPWTATYYSDPLVIQQTADGGYIVAGSSSTPASFSNRDVRIVKLDAEGTVQWQKSYIGTSDDMFSSLRQTGDNGFIVLGYGGSFSFGNYDLFALKLDAGGNIEWQKVYGNWNVESASDIAQAPDGSYIVSGASCQGWCGGMSTPFLMKLDAAGAIGWIKGFSSGPTWAHVRTSAEGGFIAAGDSGVLGKFSDSGALEWQKQYVGDNSTRWVLSFEQTADGGSVMGGNTYSPTGNGSQRRLDAWMAKFDRTGGIEWQKQYGTSANETVMSLQQTADGGFVSASYSYLQGSPLTADILLMKLDPDGNMAGCPDALVLDTHADATDLPSVEGPVVLQSRDAGFTVRTDAVAARHTSGIAADVCTSTAPCISLEPAALAFGTVELGYSASQTVVIKNTGSSDLLLRSMTVTGTAGDYLLTGDCATVGVGGSCAMTVTFSPKELGARNAALSISSDDPATPTATVPLSGSGVDTVAPTVSLSVSPNILWPPNHRMVDVLVQGAAADIGSGVASTTIYVADEYGAVVTIPGFGSTIPLEAWRKGQDRDGRQYTITAVIIDGAGNQATAETIVQVPHDMR